MADDTRWYPRLADVPNVGFAGSPGVDRSALPGVNDRPRIEYGSLNWETPGGSTSASPVHRVGFADRDAEAPVLVQRTWEALELPGTISDWHFLLAGTAESLWNKRRTNPEFLPEFETFCRLDIDLISAHADQFTAQRDGEEVRYYTFRAFPLLLNLLRTVGDLDEALTVARIGAQFNPDQLAATLAELEEQRQESV